MQSIFLKAFRKPVLTLAILVGGVTIAFAQAQQVNLSAGPSTITLPDGSMVPMWGYSCGAVVVGSTATCAAASNSSTWSPVIITLPTGSDLTINLTNNLTFGSNSIPTSLLMVGQVGGGLGDVKQRTTTLSPPHTGQGVTWPIANTGPTFTPPSQGPRVQSFSTEVQAGSTTALTWAAPRAGTYLLESGTHPSIQGPMGLYGIVVVTSVPSGGTAGSAYPGITYNADVPLVLSEIDPVQNNAVSAVVNTANFSETMVWSGQPGGCGNPNSPTYRQCYPPAVNYTPLYYLINGVAFDKTNSGRSLFTVSPASGVTGNVLVRIVNAGLRMHVPSLVGAQTGTSAVPGVTLIAEDGNPLPGVARVQTEVFMAAGKTYDVMVNAPAAGAPALPIYDRQLSLSGNASFRDSGMVAYIGINGGGLPSSPAFASATANPDTYNSVTCASSACNTLTVSDPAKGVIANDINVYGVAVQTPPTNGTLSLAGDGTFSYVPNPGWSAGDSFTYCGNGATSGAACAMVTLGAAAIEGGAGITMGNITFTSNVANSVSIKPPGILSVDKDGKGYPLTVNSTSVSALTGPGTGTLAVDVNGGFNATVTMPGTYTFTYKAQNSQGSLSTSSGTVAVIFPAATGLKVSVVDGNDKTTPIADYRWIIEEDRTFYIDPNCTSNPPAAGCPTAGGIVPTFGTNFHTSYMPVIATGCTGSLACESGQKLLGQAAVCDVGNGVCRTGVSQQTAVDPSQVHLDPKKRYYISVLPGDAANPFETSSASPGHGMGGAPITFGQTSVTVLTQPTPFPPAKLSVFVFEDDFPLNGEQDAGGGIDVLATNEPGLGGFAITLFDDAGGTGDATGQMTYDMFNMPLSNSLAGTIDPATGNDSCPISPGSRKGIDVASGNNGAASPTGITGVIVTCPQLESDGVTLSPLAGQAVVANLMPGRYGVVATPAADRIARGEEWLQTNTLDGQKAHDSFLRIGEPSYFQEFGPAGYHVSIGFANPAIINGRLKGVCSGADPNITGANCTNTVTGMVTTERMSRTPDERLYSSGSNDSFAFTQCYVSFGDPDGEDIAFTKCNPDGTFAISGLPDGSWRVTVFDQWNDMLVDGLSTPVALSGGKTTDMGQIAMNQWQANIYTKSFFDLNGNGIQDGNEPGLTLVSTNIRFRDGSYSNFNNTDLQGNAGFNEVFPLFSWYVVESDTTRYKNMGTHVVYDAGGPADGTTGGGASSIGHFLANTVERIPLPASLRVPGARYCHTADCAPGDTSGGSTGRVDPAWVYTEGWQGFSGQNSFIEFGKKPFAVGETGGIHGEVIYASTRPFDDPSLLIHTSWTPNVPGVTINLYQEGTGPDGTQSLNLVDTTKTTSWDDWAQGFRSDGMPNMNCPGQGLATGTNADLFFFTLFNQPMWLDVYNNAGTPAHTLPSNSQFKCYDGMHNWNQVQPAPYDGMYQFPSVTSMNPQTGKPTGTNCTVCVPNPDTTDTFRVGTPMLPAGKYVVEVVVPPGYELVKEEDKNILIGDNYIAPATQQFAGLGNVFILPDQAQIGTFVNANNPQNPTQTLGTFTYPRNEGDTGSVEQFWPCVGASRVVPDYISLFPQSREVAPFAGATRNLCDRKEVTLNDQSSALAKFWVFTSTHAAAHFTGVITDDFTSEFDPFSPQFGEKFSPPNLPISLKDWTGSEISRVYTDQWGTYNGLNYSTWEVNPPNPTGYAPTMMVTCMNDPGPILDGSGTMITDPLYNPEYSQFCYEIPFMPGQTQYMDTPVVPTSAFAGAGYNNPDCAYPDATPAIREVDGDGVGPWVSAAGHTIMITALGDQSVPNYGYSGPSAATAPFNQKNVSRHYGFGSTQGSVSIGGITAPVTSWSDSQIAVTVPAGVPPCNIQQQAQYGGTSAQCGELVITASNGKQSIDSVTVTVGGKTPTHVLPSGTIQGAIDAASPGDLIIVNPGTYSELLIMWKPVRLQGVGSASSIINANAHPAGKLDPWRAKVNCLFGLALNGQPYSTPGNLVPLPGGGGSEPLNLYDPTGATTCGGWTGFNATPNNPQVDRLPLESLVGWDTTVNGNLAELLQEPSLMGAYEGAGITVLAKGVRYPPGVEVFGACNCDTASGSFTAHEGQMPVPTVELSKNDCSISATNPTNPFPSNFQCNPSSIDGLAVTNSSQGGGGIFIHAWAHNLEIANNRIYNNAGTMTGGITVGQAESPDALLAGNGGDPIGYNGGTLAGFDQQPWTCVPGAVIQTTSTPFGYDEVVLPPGFISGQQLPYCYNLNVNVHNNAITRNSSLGDEAFSSTPAGAGGVTFCTGADYYKFNYNWVCGNLSTGDGGGMAHLGFSFNGDIEHNTILFNQSTNPTISTNGGGVVVMTTAPDGASATQPECGSVTDIDCAPGLGDGTGPGLTINANLIMGNAAESGSGGGIRFQGVNGTEISRFPLISAQWYGVTVTNNIIANNVAGWDGAGISLQDALAVNLINNTVISNDSTASAGVLFNTLGAPLASSPGATNQTTSTTTSAPQPAGLVAIQNSPPLIASLPATVLCPLGHAVGLNIINGACRKFSVPLLYNNVFWQNRSFFIGVGSLGTGTQNQQNVVSLYNAFTSTAAVTQPTTDSTAGNGTGTVISGGTGACVTPVSYWDIGVRGDTGPSNHGSGLMLAPAYSVISDASDYPGGNNTSSNPTVLSQYCNGSRTPPEFKSLGYQVPPGISDATVPNPIFNLTPSATVDEGNNWINISWGPLALTNPASGINLGNYGPASSSSVINYVPATALIAFALAPNTDFFGTQRKTNGAVDAGAVEFVAGAATAIANLSGGPLSFGTVATGTTSPSQQLVLHNVGTAGLTGITIATAAPFSRPAGTAGGTCGATLAAATTCTINVVFSPTVAGPFTGALSVAASVTVTGSPVSLSGTGSAATRTASVSPSTLSFGNWVTGTTSAPLSLTITNTGNTALAGGTFTFGGGTPLSFSRINSGSFPASAPNCGSTLGTGASCTIKVVFTPSSAATISRTLTVAYTGAIVTPPSVSLAGTGVSTRATVSISPNPQTITLPTGSSTGTALVTLTNTQAAGGTSTMVSNVSVSGGTFTTYFFSVGALAGPNNCTGVLLAPGAACTVTVRFTNISAARGVDRAGMISFTDSATGSPQRGNLIGHANP